MHLEAPHLDSGAKALSITLRVLFFSHPLQFKEAWLSKAFQSTLALLSEKPSDFPSVNPLGT